MAQPSSPAPVLTGPSSSSAASTAVEAPRAGTAACNGGGKRWLRIFIDGIENFPLRPATCCCSRTGRFRRRDSTCCRFGPTPREHVQLHVSEIEPRRYNTGALPATHLLQGGRQIKTGAVIFNETLRGRFIETAFAHDWRLRFEVHDSTGDMPSVPLAYVEIEAADLARERQWSLLLSDPINHEAVYGTPARLPHDFRQGSSRVPEERVPAFLLVRTELFREASTEKQEPVDVVAEEPFQPIWRSMSIQPSSFCNDATDAGTESHSASWHAGQLDALVETTDLGARAFARRRKRAMLITRGTRGDVQPFMALARGLVLYHDCDVTIVTELCWKKFVKTARQGLRPGSIQFRPSGGDTMKRVDDQTSRLILRYGQHSDSLQTLIFSRSEVEFFPSEGCVYYWASVENPDFLVFGFTMTHIAMIVSEALKKPIVGFRLQIQQSIEPLNPRTVLEEVSGPIREVINGPEFTALLRQVMERLPDGVTLNELRVSRGLAPCPRHFDSKSYQSCELHKQKVQTVVPISPHALGSQAGEVERCGMTLTDFIFLRLGTDELDAKVAGFIDRARTEGRSVIAMTFSSMPVGERLIIELAVDICNHCLPPAGKPEDRRKPACIVMCGGQDHEPAPPALREKARLLEEEGQLLLMYSGLPFGALFPAVDAAVLHGGLGVTSEAIIAGIPVITTGILLLDQRYWAARLAELGCGPEAVTIAELTGQRAADRSTHKIVELVNKALDRRGIAGSAAQGAETSTPASSGTLGDDRSVSWSRRAEEVRRLILESAKDDPDGVQRNAAAVFRAGTGDCSPRGTPKFQPAVVTAAYARGRGFFRTSCRQATCLVRCLQQTLRWLLCIQVPACLMPLWHGLLWVLWMLSCRWALCTQVYVCLTIPWRCLQWLLWCLTCRCCMARRYARERRLSQADTGGAALLQEEGTGPSREAGLRVAGATQTGNASPRTTVGCEGP